jgi:hypothetical protein
LHGQVSADVQGQQGNWRLVQDFGDFKAAAILGSCVCYTQRIRVLFPQDWDVKM